MHAENGGLVCDPCDGCTLPIAAGDPDSHPFMLCRKCRQMYKAAWGMLAALEQIAELEGDCERQQFRLTRFQAAQIARAALNAAKRT